MAKDLNIRPTIVKPAAETEPREEISGYEFELPAGLTEDGVLYKDVVLSEMTGEDEENISAPGVSKNGAKIITLLLTSCLKKLGNLEVTSERIRSMFSGDRDFLLLKLRIVTFGNKMVTTALCPSCKNQMKVEVNLNDVEIKTLPENSDGTFPFTLEKGYTDKDGTHKTGLMKLPTGEEQEYLSSDVANNPGVATTHLLTRCCKKLGTLKVITPDIIRKLSTKDRKIMGDVLKSNSPGPIMEMVTLCPKCQAQWTSPLSTTDFFGQ